LTFIGVPIIISDFFRIISVQELLEVAIGLVTATTAPAAHQLWVEVSTKVIILAVVGVPIIKPAVISIQVSKRTTHIIIEANKSFGIGALCDACTCVGHHADCLSDAEDSSSSEGRLDHVFVVELLFAMNVLF